MRRGPRQRDIVQIAESGDIDHRGATAAEPSGTDTSDLTTTSPPLSTSCPTVELTFSSPRRYCRLALSSSPSLADPLRGRVWRFVLAGGRERLLHIKNLFRLYLISGIRGTPSRGRNPKASSEYACDVSTYYHTLNDSGLPQLTCLPS